MDITLFTDIVKQYPANIPLNTNRIIHLYNEISLIPITYRDIIQIFSESPELHALYLDSKEQRQRKLDIALKDAEDTLYQKAQEGDIRAIEFLLKARNQLYKEQKELKVTLSSNEDYRQKIQQRRLELEDAIQTIDAIELNDTDNDN